MRHNDAVTLLGRCPCPCGILPRSRAAQEACWCDQRRRTAETTATPEEVQAARTAVERAGGSWEAPGIAHNDAVKHLGACPCPCHSHRGPCRCRERSGPELTRAFRRAEEKDLQRRLRTGRARPEEYLRHAPHLLPGLHRNS